MYIRPTEKHKSERDRETGVTALKLFSFFFLFCLLLRAQRERDERSFCRFELVETARDRDRGDDECAREIVAVLYI